MDTAKKQVTGAKLSGTWTTYLGAAHGVLTAAGLSDLSLIDMAGLTGMAFHFFIEDSCSPASVTVYDWVGRHQNAMDRIGILTTTHHVTPDSPTYDAARRKAIEDIKRSLDDGIGVTAWGIDSGEFGVIYGYDDHDGVFLVDGVDKFNRPLGSDPMLYENLALKFPYAPILYYQIALQQVDFDLIESYRRSLMFYINVMERTFHVAPQFHSGLRAYDAWMTTLEDNTFDAFGVRYAASVYAESKHFAAEYLLNVTHHWKQAPATITRMATLLEKISVIFGKMMKDVLEQDWDGAKHLGKKISTAQAREMRLLLKEALGFERQSIELAKSAFES